MVGNIVEQEQWLHSGRHTMNGARENERAPHDAQGLLMWVWILTGITYSLG